MPTVRINEIISLKINHTFITLNTQYQFIPALRYPMVKFYFSLLFQSHKKKQLESSVNTYYIIKLCAN